MEKFDLIHKIWDKLQFGFDLLAPIVAIALFFKWIKEQRKKSINDELRSALLQNLISTTNAVSKLFIYEVVESCQYIEKRIDRLVEESTKQDAPADYLKNLLAKDRDSENYIFLQLGKSLEKPLEAIDKFQMEFQSARYTIFPLMHSLGAEEYITKLLAEIDDVIDIYNELVKTSACFMAMPTNPKIFENRDQYFKLASGELQKARIQCKELCSFASALIEQVITGAAPEKFKENLTKYQTALKVSYTIR